MQKTYQLPTYKKKFRSLIKRFFLPLINRSDSYFVQHLPECFSKNKIDFSIFRKIWSDKNNNNNQDFVRLLFFIFNVEEILKENILGAFAELGVYKGHSAKILHSLAPQKNLYLFDTFQGFSKNDASFETEKVINLQNFTDTSINDVKKFISPSEKVHFCPGYFPDTASLVPSNEKFALVHLDADLYKPTKEALEFFYPRMVSGGLIIVHDYFSGSWPGVAKAVDEFLKDRAEKIIKIPDKSGTVVFRKI
ncbi:MAG: class I SAM-dependent methyltransferase [Chlamydiae bacterium]|nr:class I SAM-dependent methyltransferase [Chlamydiota bacterium]